MINYFKYLLKNPLKILWSILSLSITTAIGTNILLNKEEFLSNNPLWLYYITLVLLTFISGAVLYQPYKEWKDMNK
jgi:hypothetical protein